MKIAVKRKHNRSRAWGPGGGGGLLFDVNLMGVQHNVLSSLPRFQQFHSSVLTKCYGLQYPTERHRRKGFVNSTTS